MPNGPPWQTRVSGLQPGTLITLNCVHGVDRALSQLSRPSSSGSSDRDVTLRIRRSEPGIYTVIRSGKAVREEVVARNASAAGLKRGTRRGEGGQDADADAGLAGRRGKRQRLANGSGDGTRATASEHGVGEMRHGSSGAEHGVEVPATQTADPRHSAAKIWLRAQLPESSDTTLAAMVVYLYTLADHDVAAAWHTLLGQWRIHMTLVVVDRADRAVSAGEEQTAQQQRAWLVGEEWDREFVALYDRAKQMKVARMLERPQGWLAMAALGRKYRQLHEGGEGPGNRSQRAVAKDEMFRWLYKAGKKGREWAEFTRDVKYWKRWLTVVEALPQGALALFPDSFPKTWLEQRLKAGELDIWLRAVKMFRPEVVKLGESIMPILTEALAGRGPPLYVTLLELWDGKRGGFEAMGSGWFEEDIAIDATQLDGINGSDRAFEPWDEPDPGWFALFSDDVDLEERLDRGMLS